MAMLIFNLHDDQGHSFDRDDFDIYLLAGRSYQPRMLPKGFFMDRQLNAATNRLVYYLNADKMKLVKNGLFGIRIVARPSSGFASYFAGEFRSEGVSSEEIIVPNQTTYVDITLKRQVDKNVFRFDPASQPRRSFRKLQPAKEPIGD